MSSIDELTRAHNVAVEEMHAAAEIGRAHV